LYPDSGSSDFSIDNYISADFNLPVDTATIASGIIISPPVHGPFEAFENSIFTRTIVDLIPDTMYTVKFTKELKSTNGEQLKNPRGFSFRTGDFAVSYYSPSSAVYGTARNSEIFIDLTGIVDTNSVGAAFTIAPAIAGHFGFGSPARGVDFFPDSLLAPNTEYDVKVSTALKSIGGYALKHPLEFTFTTGAE
jgi:hypothetical protein